MKIKEGGGMDIKEDKELSFDTQDFPKEVWVFDADNLDQGTEISHLMMSHTEQYTKDELLVICRQASMVIDQLRTDLAQAQAVPEGFVVLAIDDMERICRCLDDHAVYITYKASDALESIQKAMIEAQEQK